MPGAVPRVLPASTCGPLGKGGVFSLTLRTGRDAPRPQSPSSSGGSLSSRLHAALSAGSAGLPAAGGHLSSSLGRLWAPLFVLFPNLTCKQNSNCVLMCF